MRLKNLCYDLWMTATVALKSTMLKSILLFIGRMRWLDGRYKVQSEV